MKLTALYPPDFEPSTEQFLKIEEYANLLAITLDIPIYDALAELCE